VQVAATLQQETSRKNDLLVQKKGLEARLREAERRVELEQGFQTSFQATLRSDLARQRAELRRLQALADSEAAAGVGTAPPTDLEAQLESVRRRIRLLESVSRGGATPYDGLALRREYARSVAASDEARESIATLRQGIADLDEALAQKDALLASINASPFRLAISGDVALGFVPYGNLDQVKVGQSLARCRVGAFVCRPVGKLEELLPGEVRGASPFGSEELRGRLVRLSLSDAAAVQDRALLAGP
jgi:hypothetical protein